MAAPPSHWVRPPPPGAPPTCLAGPPPLTECTCYLKRSLRICGPNCSPYGIGGAPDLLSKKGGCTLTGSGVGPPTPFTTFLPVCSSPLADKCKIRLRRSGPSSQKSLSVAIVNSIVELTSEPDGSISLTFETDLTDC